MINEFAMQVIGKIDAESNLLAIANGRGGSDTLEAYREKVGRVKGLDRAIEIVLQMIDEFDKDEE